MLTLMQYTRLDTKSMMERYITRYHDVVDSRRWCTRFLRRVCWHTNNSWDRPLLRMGVIGPGRIDQTPGLSVVERSSLDYLLYDDVVRNEDETVQDVITRLAKDICSTEMNNPADALGLRALYSNLHAALRELHPQTEIRIALIDCYRQDEVHVLLGCVQS